MRLSRKRRSAESSWWRCTCGVTSADAAFEDPRAAALAPQSLEEEEHAVLSESLAGWSEQYPDVKVRREVYLDNPRGRLLDWSAKAQLVVVGSRGRGGFRGMFARLDQQHPDRFGPSAPSWWFAPKNPDPRQALPLPRSFRSSNMNGVVT